MDCGGRAPPQHKKMYQFNIPVRQTTDFAACAIVGHFDPEINLLLIEVGSERETQDQGIDHSVLCKSVRVWTCVHTTHISADGQATWWEEGGVFKLIR